MQNLIITLQAFRGREKGKKSFMNKKIKEELL
jgi:hypothetical protein